MKCRRAAGQTLLKPLIVASNQKLIVGSRRKDEYSFEFPTKMSNTPFGWIFKRKFIFSLPSIFVAFKRKFISSSFRPLKEDAHFFRCLLFCPQRPRGRGAGVQTKSEPSWEFVTVPYGGSECVKMASMTSFGIHAGFYRRFLPLPVWERGRFFTKTLPFLHIAPPMSDLAQPFLIFAWFQAILFVVCLLPHF